MTDRTVTSAEARSAILRCFAAKRPLFLWGPPGIGKSDLAASLAGELGGLLVDLRMPLLEPTDLRGIPFYNKDSGKMEWAPPIDLPDAETAAQYPIVVLFLDEMNAAAPAVQASAYQLILNRRVGTYKLPDNVVIIAAGNRESDKGVTYRMPAPLANRFVHLEMKVDFDSWLTWAVNNNVHKDVVGFLSFSKGDLFDFDPKSASRSFATPRSWSFVSELLEEGNADKTLTDLVSGTIGEGLAVKFMAHRKIASQMPNPTDILEGKEKDLKIKEISAMYSLVISMCYELKDALAKMQDKDGKPTADWHKMADNFFRYMMDNFSVELVVMGARVALRTYELPFIPAKLKNFNEFHEKYGKFVIAANQSN